MKSAPARAPSPVTADMISGGLVLAVLCGWTVNWIDLGLFALLRMNFWRKLAGIPSLPTGLPGSLWQEAIEFNRWWFVLLAAGWLVVSSLWILLGRPSARRTWVWTLVGSFLPVAIVHELYYPPTSRNGLYDFLGNLLFSLLATGLLVLGRLAVTRTMIFLRERS